ncbi:hypothetical protein AMATHDRAFT_8031 [Amanita thiersii Skay4041]|uniref:FAD/NAD(P)-binding domain-containing protein n=1 Tax=Amanita thiersii Skay4041 TaxID=703135 RepID=A0A2A9NDE7_9AGAR|nr:hypothetical protein AMATHDRAFT_8031 [Amanita thiersii Skay4041]
MTAPPASIGSPAAVNNHAVNSSDAAQDVAYKLGNFSIDDPRPMKVIVIGAGFSGLTAAIRFRQKMKNLDLVVYEAHAGVGGTWFANRYPGIACDIPSHTYQLTFEENTKWSSFYAPGPEILTYLEGVANKYKLLQYIRLRHRVTSAQYIEDTGKWRLTIRRPTESFLKDNDSQTRWNWESDYEEFEDEADVLFTGIGGLSRWSWPDIEGLETFQGKVIHSAQWETGEKEGDNGVADTIKNWTDKKVGVIGVGSTAIQIVPALQPKVKHLINFVRGRTWVASPILQEKILQLSHGEVIDNYYFTEDDMSKFSDPNYYKAFRHDMESFLNSVHSITLKGTPLQEGARGMFNDAIKKRLDKKPWIADKILPDFPVCCRRLTPGPGYLEALCEDNVDFVSSHIKRVTPTGIETADGKHWDLDVIVCATGFNTNGIPDFPIIGRNGTKLSDKFKPYPRTYLSVAVDGFPNWFASQGPNSAIGSGSLLIIIERQVDYAVAATLKMQRERLKSLEVMKEAVDDFDEYLEAYFPTTVFSERCPSWYKMGKETGRVVGLWPGSCVHAIRALQYPRWEDYSSEPLDADNTGRRNRFYWLGDGNALADRDPTSDRAWYLDEVDYPPVPE